MKKTLYSLAAIFFTIVLLTSCKKYPDGPSFSLASRKARITNDWKIDKILNNGNDVTSQYMFGFNNYVLSIRPDFSIIEKWDSATTKGSWQWGTKKGGLLITNTNATFADGIYSILRLESKELWLQSGSFDFHLIRTK